MVGFQHAADREADTFGVVGVDGPEFIQVVVRRHPHVLVGVLGVDPPMTIIVEFLGVFFLVVIIEASGHSAEAILVRGLGGGSTGKPFLSILQHIRGVLVGIHNLEQVFPVFTGRHTSTFGANALLDGRTQIEPTVNLAVLLVVIEAAGIVLGIVLQVLLEPAASLAIDRGVIDTDNVVDVLVTGIRKRFRASRIVQFRNGILAILFGLLYGVLFILDSLFVAVDQFLVVFIDYRARSHCYRSNTAGNE